MNIAIIGASADRTKFGNKAVRAYLSKGHKVFPVNPDSDEIEGLKCYHSILDVAEKIDYASLYLPASVSVTLVDDIAKKTKKVFVNPGAESDELVKKLKAKKIETILACSIRAIGEDPKKY